MTTKAKKSFNEIIKNAKNKKESIIEASPKKANFFKMSKGVQKKIIKEYYAAYSDILNVAYKEGMSDDQVQEIIVQLAAAFGDEFALLARKPDASAYEKVCDIAGIKLEFVDGVADLENFIQKAGEKIPVASENKKEGFVVEGAGAYPGAFEGTRYDKKIMLEFARKCYKNPQAYCDIPVLYFFKGNFIEAVTDMIKKQLFKQVEGIQDVESMQLFEKEVEKIGQMISEANAKAVKAIEEQNLFNELMKEKVDILVGYKHEILAVCGKTEEKNVFKFDGNFENIQTVEIDDIVKDYGEKLRAQELKKEVYKNALAMIESYIEQFDGYRKSLYEKAQIKKTDITKFEKNIAQVMTCIQGLITEADLYDRALAKTQEKINVIGKDFLK